MTDSEFAERMAMLVSGLANPILLIESPEPTSRLLNETLDACYLFHSKLVK